MKIFDDPVEWIKTRPEMFLWQGNIGLQLSTNIISDALLLTGGPVTVLKKHDWWIIGSEIDWVENQSDYSIDELFSRIISYPEAGQNSMRGEVLLMAFADDVVTIDNKKTLVIKSSTDIDINFLLLLQSENHWKRIVAFRVISEKFNPNQ
jgi:hypothetical protein